MTVLAIFLYIRKIMASYSMKELPWWLSGIKNSPARQETRFWSPGSGRDPREGNSYTLQNSCLENPMVRGAWRATVHGGCKQSDTTERLYK